MRNDPNSWLCVLCRKICHHRGLGDLYGPYKVDLTEEPKAPKKNPANAGDDDAPKNNGASTSTTPQQTTAANTTAPKTTQSPPKKSKYSLLANFNLNTTNDNIKEIWIHEDCLVWSEGVHIVGKQILNMDQVIKDSFHHNCSLCKVKGATIGCSGKRCRRKFHYVCARDAPSCLLDEANFTLKCDKCLANTAANLSFSIKR